MGQWLCEEIRNFIQKMAQLLAVENYRIPSEKIKIELLYKLAILHLDIYQKELKSGSWRDY